MSIWDGEWMSMKHNIMDYDTVALNEEKKTVVIIDQTLLPGQTKLIELLRIRSNDFIVKPSGFNEFFQIVLRYFRIITVVNVHRQNPQSPFISQVQRNNIQ